MNILLSLVVLVFGVIIGGATLDILWDWFVVPTFGISSLGIATAIGVRALLSVAKGIPSIPSATYSPLEAAAMVVVWNGLHLLIGYIVLQFV